MTWEVTTVERAMAIAARAGRKYRNALRELARGGQLNPEPGHSPLQIRPLQPGEEEPVSRLIREVLDEPGVPPIPEDAGALANVRPDAMRYRGQQGSVFLLALEGERIIGVIEIEGLSHIALLFVARDRRRRGVARRLWESARAFCRTFDPGGRRFTVNSLESALPVYRSLGFVECGPPMRQDGLVTIPMRFDESAASS